MSKFMIRYGHLVCLTCDKNDVAFKCRNASTPQHIERTDTARPPGYLTRGISSNVSSNLALGTFQQAKGPGKHNKVGHPWDLEICHYSRDGEIQESSHYCASSSSKSRRHKKGRRLQSCQQNILWLLVPMLEITGCWIHYICLLTAGTMSLSQLLPCFLGCALHASPFMVEFRNLTRHCLDYRYQSNYPLRRSQSLCTSYKGVSALKLNFRTLQYDQATGVSRYKQSRRDVPCQVDLIVWAMHGREGSCPYPCEEADGDASGGGITCEWVPCYTQMAAQYIVYCFLWCSRSCVYASYLPTLRLDRMPSKGVVRLWANGANDG